MHFIGVDVGTGSARAALVTSKGKVLKTHVEAIQTWTPVPQHYEQSSENIWESVCKCVKEVTSGYDINEIGGIGFDATCSLVALDSDGNPITISTTENRNQNIVLWMDHRAVDEAQHINNTHHELLKYVGGKVSLEMQMAKILWLKKNKNEVFKKLGHLFDLPDFLTWKSTGVASRSICSVVCKWNYDANNGGWSKSFLNQIGLNELTENNFQLIGNVVLEPGLPIGSGLKEAAAHDLGLNVGTPVGASLIDAHAGALGLFGCKHASVKDDTISKMALICGTSSCHMSVTKVPIFATGIWGPYNSVIFPQMHLNEAGQSATGALLDFVCVTHPAYNEVLKKAGKQHIHVYLNEVLQVLSDSRNVKHLQELTADFHVYPDFHGNRSPMADSSLHGMICGLDMGQGEESLAITYLAFTQALAYGTRHILEALAAFNRPNFSSISICGGLSKNSLFVQTHADVCGLPVLVPREPESVLLGSAMMGALASGIYGTLEEASKAMGSESTVIMPDQSRSDFHKRKYAVFLKMLHDQLSYRKMMQK